MECNNEATRIKMCGFTRGEDVDAAVAAGADAVGFVLYAPSPRYVPPERAVALAQRLPESVTPVLLFVNASPTEVAAVTERVPRAVVQFHGDETPGQCRVASGAHRWWKVARIGASAFDWSQFLRDYEGADAVLIDTLTAGFGGGGVTFDLNALPDRIEKDVVLAGGLTPDNVAARMAAMRGRCRRLAVDVSSGIEPEVNGQRRRGIKDRGKMERFVAAVRAADASAKDL